MRSITVKNEVLIAYRVASSVILRSNGEPFIAAYEVSVDIIQPAKIIKHLENATASTTSTNSTSQVM